MLELGLLGNVRLNSCYQTQLACDETAHLQFQVDIRSALFTKTMK